MSHEIRLTTELPLPAERAAALISRPETFLHVCRPLLGVRGGAGMLPSRWEAGQVHELRLTVLGVPTVLHRIEILEADAQQGYARTRERDRLLRTWNHTLRVEPLDAGRCLYSDVVETGRGPRGRVVALGGRLFFRYRQRRLRRLAAGL